jgi:uncharacterized protein (DUF433 family)
VVRPIVCTPGTCGGAPRIDGSRLTCENVVAILSRVLTLPQFLENYSYLRVDDVKACLTYCAQQQCLDDHPENYCHHCILDLRTDVPPTVFLSEKEFLEVLSGEKEAPEGAGIPFGAFSGKPITDPPTNEVWVFAKQLLDSLK